MSTGPDVGFECIICGGPADRPASLCSTHCRAEADMELRRNRRRIRELRRLPSRTVAQGQELRGLFDRNADLDVALIDSAAPLPRSAS